MSARPEVVYSFAASLDGFIATPDGKVGWLDEFHGDPSGFTELWDSIDGLLMGRGTYEFALAHEPWMAPDRPSWIFTRQQLRLAADDVTLTSEAPAELLRRLHAQGHRRLWLVGGGALAASFQAEDLITHYEVTVVPILLGKGIPLFAPFTGHRRLELTATRPQDNGLVQLLYRPKSASGTASNPDAGGSR